MKNKSFEITIIIGLIVFSLILFGIYLIYDTYLKSKSYTLFLKPYSILECKKWDCKDISNNLREYNNKPYNTYINGNNLDIKDIYYNDRVQKFYVFDKNDNNIYDEGSLFGYTGKAKITSTPYKIEPLTENELETLKKELKLNVNNDEIMLNSKIAIDFDNDGKIETLYQIATTIDASDADLYFNYIIYEKENKYNIIMKENSLDIDFIKIGESTISSILDIFDDGKLEFIVFTTYPLTGKTCSILYRLKGKNFIPINECKSN